MKTHIYIQKIMSCLTSPPRKMSPETFMGYNSARSLPREWDLQSEIRWFQIIKEGGLGM